ncbi:hypothetical protein AB4Y40_16220 [Paraburkholderia sp. EG287B]|uniref:hypothetical protein n=1 Tax=Paraburkholderia sp. EG287B TaxID=3237010 RepID=UPI0034D1EE3F
MPSKSKWGKGRAWWGRFCTELHPELGMSGTRTSWNHFHQEHGETLAGQDISRRSSTRAEIIVDVERADVFVFDLLTGKAPDAEAQ